MESCPRGFLCLDNNTLVLSLVIIFFIIAYLASLNKIERQKLDIFNDLNKNKEDLLNYMNSIQKKVIILNSPSNRNLNKDNNDSYSDNNIDKKTLNRRDTIIKNNNIYINPPNSNTSNNSMIINKEYERLINPLLPPERSYDTRYSVPINIPTRGYASNYQQVGVVTAETSQGSKILPLYGRQLWKGSNRWNFYTSTDQYNSLKLPVYSNKKDCQDQVGCDELYDGDEIVIPQYGENKFKVSMYKLDIPEYIG